MALSQDPIQATKIISFDEKVGGSAAIIRYNLSLPGRHTGQRVIRLDLGLTGNDFRGPASTTTPGSIEAIGWQKPLGSATWTYNARAALGFFFDKLRDAGLDSLYERGYSLLVREATKSLIEDGYLSTPIILPQLFQDESITKIWSHYSGFLNGLGSGQLVIPIKNWDGKIVTSTTPADAAITAKPSDANIFLVETYGISSFLGDYGLGRTVRTFSLLPGEETRISIKTWRSTQSKVAEASSIIDSYTDSAAGRFTNSAQHQTTDKKNRANQLKWHAEAEVNAKWGWGDAKVSGGAAGEYQESRETFAQQLDNAVQEHTNQASSARDTTITSSSETTAETGEETLTERTIRNANLRRVLNFVFRELNQEYITKIHLLDIKVAFTNGTTNSWREVPLSGLRGLLEEILKDSQKIDNVASQILGIAGTIMDFTDKPVNTLERINVQNDGTYKINPAQRDTTTGAFLAPPSDRSFLYRFKRGPLEQPDSESNKVDGVFLKQSLITMRTESVVVEALLGQADALDSYATHSQLAEVEAKQQATRKQKIALDTLEAITDPKERSAAYAQMFNPPPASLPPVVTPPTP